MELSLYIAYSLLNSTMHIALIITLSFSDTNYHVFTRVAKLVMGKWDTDIYCTVLIINELKCTVSLSL